MKKPTPNIVEQLADFKAVIGQFKPTLMLKWLLNTDKNLVLFSKGNRAGGTATLMFNYVLRILGWHPQANRNVTFFYCDNGHQFSPLDLINRKQFISDNSGWHLANSKCPHCEKEIKKHQRETTTFRFCSEILPTQTDDADFIGVSAEVKNTLYPTLKKWLPKFLIKKDITFRNPSMVIKDFYGGEDIIVEFVSYNQRVQSTAGVDRLSVYIDECASSAFLEEQHARLIKEKGDLVISYTPADRASYLFDMIHSRASVVYRTASVRKRYADRFGVQYPEVEEIKNGGISRFMHKLGVGYAEYFNHKYNRVGTFFQSRFKAELADSEQYLQYLLVYINVINPGQIIEPKLKEEGVKNIKKIMKFAEEFPWSTHQEYLNKRKSIIIEKGLLGEIFSDPEYYRDFCESVLIEKKINKISHLFLE